MFECPEERNGFFVKHLLKNMTDEDRNKSIEEVLLGVSRGKVNTFVVNNNSMKVGDDDNIDKFFQWPVWWMTGFESLSLPLDVKCENLKRQQQRCISNTSKTLTEGCSSQSE